MRTVFHIPREVQQIYVVTFATTKHVVRRISKMQNDYSDKRNLKLVIFKWQFRICKGMMSFNNVKQQWVIKINSGRMLKNTVVHPLPMSAFVMLNLRENIKFYFYKSYFLIKNLIIEMYPVFMKSQFQL